MTPDQELLNKAQLLFNRNGKLSIPLLQCRLKISYQMAEMVMKYFKK